MSEPFTEKHKQRIEREHFVWVEKYRPKFLDECILPSAVTASLQGILQQKNTPNLLLTGRAGTGKTTVAKALTRELNADALVINASDERNIEVLRGKIHDYASTMTLDGLRKYVILDEADYLNPQSTQPALRSFMEEFSEHCGFILTANFPNKIIPPLQSRCSVVDFKIPSAEKGKIAQATYHRCAEILKTEGVSFTKAVLLEVVKIYFPDFRRILNELQRFSSTGTLSEAILSQLSDKDVDTLFEALKSKRYDSIRKWVGLHEDMDAASFFRMLTEQVPERVLPDCVSELIVQLGDYNFRYGFAADPMLNSLACLTEIMHSARWQ